jgi:hypothetical protein
LTKTVSPGLARLTAAWMDCPGPTTIVADAEADAAPAALSATPSPAAHAAAINLRTLPPPAEERPGEQEERVPPVGHPTY